MKNIVASTLLLYFISVLTSCGVNKKSEQKDVIKNSETSMLDNYLGSNCKGNYVWGGAMNLAWDELSESIIHEKIRLQTEDAKVLDMVEKLNNAPFSKNDLDESSYYIKSGYGQKTVEQINRESRAKFPSKSFSDLDLQLNPLDIISYAYFLKEVEYETTFKVETVIFNEQGVKGFIAENKEQKKNVKIIKYDNDDKFIIKLQLKDNSDELILAKGYEMDKPQAIVNEINKNDKDELPFINHSDRFEAPKIHLDYRRNYVELMGKFFKNKGFESYLIDQMFENIKFDMDEKGARVENEAVMVSTLSAVLEPEPSKNFILNKPYWIVMKRKDSKNPYFILGINNTELMEKN